MAFTEGDLLVISAKVLSDSAQQDADNVEIVLKNALATIRGQMMRSANGDYVYSFNTSQNAPGLWQYQIFASGNYQGTTIGQFKVAPKI
jgi:hypothetical protein